MVRFQGLKDKRWWMRLFRYFAPVRTHIRLLIPNEEKWDKVIDKTKENFALRTIEDNNYPW